MKRLFALLLAAMLLGMAGCQKPGDSLSVTPGEAVIAPKTATLQKPPKGTLSTPEGEIDLTPAGYQWTAKGSGSAVSTTIADQASRPLSKGSLKPVTISQYAEISPSWEVSPTSVTYTCWPEGIWENSNVHSEPVDSRDDFKFCVKPGGYIYEITAKWADTGAGSYGSVNYYVYIVGGTEHSHQIASEPQTVENPYIGYCGNTQTTLYIGDKKYTFMYGHSVTLTDILLNLDYDPMRVCRCLPEYKVDTEFGTGYGIHLTQGYARCEKGQADLTQEQIDTIAGIIQWAERTGGKYSIFN